MTKAINLMLKGQGVYLFNSNQECGFFLLNQDNDGYGVYFNLDSIEIVKTSSGRIFRDPYNKSGITKIPGAYYWFCLDSQNQTFSAGIGEARIENRIYVYTFKFEPEEEHLRKQNKTFLETMCKIVPTNTIPIKLLRDPIIQKIPLKVINTNNLTMDMVASGKVMPVANLSLTAQKLYNCVSGINFVLDTKEFPYFSKAIEHSIKTPGLWCHEKLKQKATEFSKNKPNILETYLRITLGQNNGESPGIPYVMEIWPPCHYSPIHSHADAEAIIRVLYGQINVRLYPFLSQDNSVQPFAQTDFFTDDVTWISPALNQTHQLKNINPIKSCITIQCYMYDAKNSVHYDYFDYVDPDGNIKKYEPDTDMDFIDFKILMKKEWDGYLNSRVIQPRKSLFCC